LKGIRSMKPVCIFAPCLTMTFQSLPHRGWIGTTVLVLSLFAAMDHSSTAGPKRAVSPPSMSKLPGAMVMAPLLDGRLIAVVGGSRPHGQEAVARYSSDGGRTWSAAET